jgi:hypothetical protein
MSPCGEVLEAVLCTDTPRSLREERAYAQGHAAAPSKVLSCLPCRAQRTAGLSHKKPWFRRASCSLSVKTGMAPSIR